MKKILIPVFILSAFAFGCGKKEPPAPKVPGVKTITIAPASIAASITLSGTVESKARAWLISPTLLGTRRICPPYSTRLASTASPSHA